MTKVDTNAEETFEDAMFSFVDESFDALLKKTATESTAERESKLQKLVNMADYSRRIKRMKSGDRALFNN